MEMLAPRLLRGWRFNLFVLISRGPPRRPCGSGRGATGAPLFTFRASTREGRGAFTTKSSELAALQKSTGDSGHALDLLAALYAAELFDLLANFSTEHDHLWEFLHFHAPYAPIIRLT